MTRTSQNSSHLPIEEYVNAVERQGGIYSNYPAVIKNSVTANSIVSTGGITGVTSPVVQSALAGATVVLKATQSGGTFQNRSTSGSPSWTLPTAANGLMFTFTTANTTAGFTVTGGTIHAKTSATGTAVTGTTLTNTQATAVVGDAITLVCDGTAWWVTAQTGIFTAA
jgi:hypothetical protein